MEQTNPTVSEERVIDLRRVFKVLWKRAWLILVVCVVSTLATFFYSEFFVTPTYRSSFSAYVNNRLTVNSEGNTSTSDLTASMGLMYVYQDVILSRSVLLEAVQYCDSTDFGDVSRLVQCYVSETAPILRVYVETEDPNLSYQLACAIEKVAPDHVKRVVDGSSMQSIDRPRIPKNPSSPDVRSSCMYAFVLSMFLAALGVVAVDLIHDRVQNDEELESRYQVAVIGRIPNFRAPEKGNDRYAKNGGRRQ